MKRSTLSEIARLAGVNPSTVSRALNPATAFLISETQRNKIIALCDKYNYRPQRAAKGCATGKSYTIGFVSGALHKDFSSPFISRYIAEISVELQRSNYSLSLLSVDGDAGNLQEGVRSILLSDIADGYIIGSGMVKELTEEIFRCTGRPILTLGYHLFDNSRSRFSSVEINIEEAIALIWQTLRNNLTELKSCFFGKPTVSSSAKVGKIRQYAPPLATVAEIYIPDPVNYSHMDFSQAEETAERVWKDLLQYNIIWCGSDLVAAGLCAVLKRHGVEPGKDIIVIGYDHISAVMPEIPNELATIDPCWAQAGKVTAQKILELVANPDAPPVSEVIHAQVIPGRTMPFQVNNPIFQEKTSC